jgi:hypothetical protein
MLEQRFDPDSIERAPVPTEPAGEEWDEAELASRFPRLRPLYESGDDDSSGKPWWKFW